jgi:WD40 repeat protein/serine/threonine protein kinase
LRPAQLEELTREGPERFLEARTLAQYLLERGWVTPFQINQLLLERGSELVLGPYLLIGRLGEGFSGTVFKARHQRMNRVVALRVVRKELLANPEAIRQFYAQVEAASKLAHDNVVHAYDAGPIGETHFLATEYVAGTDLARLVKQAGPLPVPRACAYIYQAALGLQHGLQHGLAHHGLKPSKLILVEGHGSPARPGGSATGAGTVKVTDLGLTRLHRVPGEAARRSSPADASEAAHYQAPEQQTENQPADIRADIYALGGIFYYLLTARSPTETASGETGPRPVDQVRPEVPPEVGTILRRMMAPAPAERYATPAEVAQELHAHIAVSEPRSDNLDFQNTPSYALGATVNLLPPGTRTQKRSRHTVGLRWTLFVALSGAILVGGFFLCQAVLFSDPTARPRSPGTSEAATLPPGAWLDPAQISAQERALAGPQPDLVAVLRGNTAPVHAVSFSPRGAHLAAAAEDGMIRLWDWNTGLLRAAWEGHSKAVMSLAFAPDGQTLASGGRDKKVKLWDVATRREKQSWPTAGEQVAYVAFTPDGQNLAGRFAAKELRLIELSSGKERHFLKTSLKTIHTFAITPDSKTLIAGTQERVLLVVDVPSNKRTYVLEGHTGPVRALAVSPDGKTLASAGDDKTVRLWDVVNYTERGTFTGHKSRIGALAFAPDSQTLASTANDGHVILWRATDKVTIGEWHLPAGVEGLAISPDGQHLTAATTNGAIYVFRLPAPAEEKKP